MNHRSTLWAASPLSITLLVAGLYACGDAELGGLDPCSYGGKTYTFGETFSADGCRSCLCGPKGVVCTEGSCGDAGAAGASKGDTYDEFGSPICGDAGATCTYAGKAFAAGTSFFTGNGCESCDCLYDGSLKCSNSNSCTDAGTVTSCTYSGKDFPVGSTFYTGIGCEQCRCGEDGSLKCGSTDCLVDAGASGKEFDDAGTSTSGNEFVDAGTSTSGNEFVDAGTGLPVDAGGSH